MDAVLRAGGRERGRDEMRKANAHEKRGRERGRHWKLELLSKERGRGRKAREDQTNFEEKEEKRRERDIRRRCSNGREGEREEAVRLWKV